MPSLLERDSAIGQLEAGAAGAAEGRGSIVVVEGPAGIGKSALLGDFLERTRTRAMVGWCDDLSIPAALEPFADIAREDRRLATAFDVDVAAFRRALLDELKAGPPTIMAIEDIHWADQATLDLLAYLGRRLHDLPSVLIATLRSGLPLDHPVTQALGRMPRELVTRIELAELSFEAVAWLAKDSGIDPVSLYELTDGNPFLVSEILATDAEVPVTIADSIAARIGTLPPPAAETAALLSVIPGEVEWELIETLLPNGATALADLELEGLIVSSPNGVGFRHELQRRAMEERLTAARRRRLNAAVLDALLIETTAASRIAHHATAAGDVDVLVEYSIVAAEDAARAGAHTQALEHVLSVVPHVDRLEPRRRAEAWQLTAREHWFNQNDTQSLEATEKAIELWDELGDVEPRAAALGHAARVEWTLGRPERTEELRRREIALLESVPPTKALTEAYIGHGQDLGLSSRIDEALLWIDRAVASAEAYGDELTRAKALGSREILRIAVGDAVGARADGDHAIDIFRRLNAQDELSVTYTNRIAAALNALSVHHIDADVRTAREYATEIDSRVLDIRLAMHVGRLHLLRGEWSAAQRTADLVLEMNPSGMRRPTALTLQALLAGRRGDSAALDALEEAIDLVTATDDIQRIGSVAAAAAELTWLGVVDWTEFLLDACHLAVRSHYLRFSSETTVWLRRLGHKAQHHGEAPEPYARELAGDHLGAAEAWQELGFPYQRALSLGFSGDPDALREAFDIMDDLGATAARDRVHQMLRDRGVTLGRRRAATTRSNPAGLTRRQMDVLSLVAEGLTNAQIADRLFVSPKTVDHHVSAILSRLGVPTRHDAAALLPELTTGAQRRGRPLTEK